MVEIISNTGSNGLRGGIMPKYLVKFKSVSHIVNESCAQVKVVNLFFFQF